MNHPSLFDPRVLARRENPETSKAAARACQSTRDGHHEFILRILSHVPAGLTADEIADRSGWMTRHQVGRRLHELVAECRVRTTGETRPTPSGRAAQCYAITDPPKETP